LAAALGSEAVHSPHDELLQLHDEVSRQLLFADLAEALLGRRDLSTQRGRDASA
jgi:hypothetical protein